MDDSNDFLVVVGFTSSGHERIIMTTLDEAFLTLEDLKNEILGKIEHPYKEDLYQDVFLGVMQRLEGDGGEKIECLKAFIRRVALNKRNDILRNLNRHRQRDLKLLHDTLTKLRPDSDPSVRCVEDENKAVLNSSIETLPPKLGEAIRRRFIDEISDRESALQFGIPIETCRSRVKLGIKLLRSQLLQFSN